MSDMVLYFRADWCGPCKRASQIFEALQQNHPEIEFLKVDVDSEAELAKTYSVLAVPTMIRITEGKEVVRVAGARSFREVSETLKLG